MSGGIIAFLAATPAAQPVGAVPVVPSLTNPMPVVLAGGSTAFMREKLTGDRTYYVRADGNNANNGQANSAAGAWLTIQYGMNWLANNIDASGFKVVLQVIGSPWNESVLLAPIVGAITNGYVAKTLCLRGDVVTPGNVVLNGGAGPAAYGVGSDTAGWLVEGFELRSAAQGIQADYGASIYVGNNDFGVCGLHAQALYGSRIEFVSSYRIVGDAAVHMYSYGGSQVLVVAGVTCTVVGARNFSSFFAYATLSAGLTAITVTYTVGAPTGARYRAENNAVINTNGGGAAYFPGNAAGSVLTGGIYI